MSVTCFWRAIKPSSPNPWEGWERLGAINFTQRKEIYWNLDALPT